MSNITNEFKAVLDKEENLLQEFSNKQVLLRKAVVEKSWEDLLKVMSEINILSDTFETLEEKRMMLVNHMQTSEIDSFHDQLSKLRRMLVKCKIENKALGDYVSITRQFMDNVIEKAVPAAGTKTYSRNGTMRKPQPKSVIVNQMF